IYVHKLMHRYIKKIEVNSNSRMSNINFLDESTNIQSQIVKSKMLITDYSSILFDFLYLNKEIILYQFDREKYYAKTPGSYIEYREINSLVIYEFNELINKIKGNIILQSQQNNQAKNLVGKYIK